MLEFKDDTGALESVLRWFHWTYRLEIIPMVGGQWVRAAWPEDGGAGVQDAWLTSALEIVAGVYNALLREQSAEKNRGREQDDE